MDLFENIDSKIKNSILSVAESANIKSGGEIYKRGFIGILNSGLAVITRTGIGGNSITIRNITEGDIFGAASVFGKWNENFSSISALCECNVSYFSENDFKNLLLQYPDFALNYIRFLTDRIRFLNRRLDTFCAGTTQNKLYEFLLSKSNGNREVELDISMSELASRLNIGRTSLYRDISALQDAGLIIRNGKKFILK